MSFDLTFFRCEKGTSPLDEYYRLIEIDLESRAPLPAFEAERLRSLLLEAHPPFALTPIPTHEDTSFQLFDESLALSLDVDSVFIEVNLTYFRDNATAAFAALARIGEALASDGFFCFDPQAGKLVDWSTGVDSMSQSYNVTSEKFASALPSLLDAPPAKPWWKFW